MTALLNLLEQFLHGHKDDTGVLCGTGDGMRLSTSCGTVGENCRIVALQNAVEECSGSAFVDFGLCRVVVKHAVKGENLVLDLLRCGEN